MSETLVREKEEMIFKYIFNWAKANGLATIPEQVKVSIRVVANAYTDKLTQDDWKIILSGQWRWTKEEREFLLLLKSAGFYRLDSDDVEHPIVSIRKKFRNSKHPYTLSDTWISIHDKHGGRGVRIRKHAKGSSRLSRKTR